MNSSNDLISSLNDYIELINNDINNWKIDDKTAWFRGEKYEYKPLRPKLFDELDKIEIPDKRNSFENNLVQEFRMRAPAFNLNTPDYNRIDEWLFLMQHTHLPTRLLDWSEGSLIALFFAINEAAPDIDLCYKNNNLCKDKDNRLFTHVNNETAPIHRICSKDNNLCKLNDPTPVVWMINPIILNLIGNGRLYYPLSYNDGSNNYRRCFPYNLELKHNIIKKDRRKDEKYRKYIYRNCPSNIHAAFEAGKCEYEEKYPIALRPQHVHTRVTSQRGCFTVHGSERIGIQDMFNSESIGQLVEFYKDSINSPYNKEVFSNPDEFLNKLIINYKDMKFGDVFLKKYRINPEKFIIKNMLEELRICGIGYSTLFPDLDGLSKELKSRYF